MEKFNSTLINKIDKSCDVQDKDRDDHFPYLLFDYRVIAQDSTQESPFFSYYMEEMLAFLPQLYYPMSGLPMLLTYKAIYYTMYIYI